MPRDNIRVMLLNWGKYSEALTVQIVRRLSACFGTSSASARRKSPVAVQEVRQYRTAQISLEAGQCWVKSELAERWRPKLGQMGVAPLIVDAGDKSSHRSRVLRAAICETTENQARSIIWCSLTFRKNPLRQFPSFSKLASFQMKSQEECEKARRMLYGQEEIATTATLGIWSLREINSQDWSLATSTPTAGSQLPHHFMFKY